MDKVFIVAPVMIGLIFALITSSQDNTGGGPIRRGLSRKIAMSGFMFFTTLIITYYMPDITNPPYGVAFFCFGSVTVASGGSLLLHLLLVPSTFTEAKMYDDWYKLRSHEREMKLSGTDQRNIIYDESLQK